MKVWFWPLLIGLLSSGALLLGLLCDNVWDDVASTLLGLPVALALCCGWRRR